MENDTFMVLYVIVVLEYIEISLRKILEVGEWAYLAKMEGKLLVDRS